jgi:hypothetical protein
MSLTVENEIPIFHEAIYLDGESDRNLAGATESLFAWAKSTIG